MDAFAKGLKVAHRLLEDRVLEDFIADRYKSFTEGIGKDIVDGKVGFKELAEYAMENDQIVNQSADRSTWKLSLISISWKLNNIVFMDCFL